MSVCVGRVVESAGCVRRVVVSVCWEGSGDVGCVCWEGGGEEKCKVYVFTVGKGGEYRVCGGGWCRVCWEGGGECRVCVLGGWWRVQGVCWKVSGECRVWVGSVVESAGCVLGA